MWGPKFYDRKSGAKARKRTLLLGGKRLRRSATNAPTHARTHQAAQQQQKKAETSRFSSLPKCARILLGVACAILCVTLARPRPWVARSPSRPLQSAFAISHLEESSVQMRYCMCKFSLTGLRGLFFIYGGLSVLHAHVFRFAVTFHPLMPMPMLPSRFAARSCVFADVRSRHVCLFFRAGGPSLL